MKKNPLFKVLLLTILCIFIAIPLYGCKSQQDKQIVVAQNVKADINSTKIEINQLIKEGNEFLRLGKFIEASISYEKAIFKDKTDESTYLEIKNNYMNVQRFDDAYFFIKLAIDNNVSKDKMSKILEEIKSNFSPILLEKTISEGDDFSLPTQTNIPVDTIPNPVNIRWPQNNIDTSNPGTSTYDGYIDEYGRTVRLTLTIREVVNQANEDPSQQQVTNKPKEVAVPKELSASNEVTAPKENTIPKEDTIPKDVTKATTIGFIDSIYEENGDTFIKFNETEFYTNEDAKREYAKDGFNPSSVEFGSDYYIRENSNDQKTYKLSKDCAINVCAFVGGSETKYKLSSELKQISKEDFKLYVGKSINDFNELANAPNPPKYNRALLFWMNTENDVVTSLNMQYTP